MATVDTHTLKNQVQSMKAEFAQIQSASEKQRLEIETMLKGGVVEKNVGPSPVLPDVESVGGGDEHPDPSPFSYTTPAFTGDPSNSSNNLTFGSAGVENKASFGAHASPSPPTSKSPLSIKLEAFALQKHADRLPFRSYLEKGYKYYQTWLNMTLGLGCEGATPEHLNFCIARNLNSTFPSKYVMGVDLEVRYIFKRLEDLFGIDNMNAYRSAMKKSLMQNLGLTGVHADSYVNDYLRNPSGFALGLSNRDFQKRLALVPTQDLDTHSAKVWRSTNHTELNAEPYPVSREDIMKGENLAPPTSRHVGLQMLEMHGFLDPLTNPRRAKPHSVTFV
jgi:hypothetical protein